MPVRIQRRRTPGWRMPTNAIYVGRPTRFGNPFGLGDTTVAALAPTHRPPLSPRECAVVLFTAHLYSNFPLLHAVRTELAGRDLACWCPLDALCHADVLLSTANPTDALTGGAS